LDTAIKLNFFLTIQQVMKRFTLLSPLAYLFIPPSVWFTMPRALKIQTQEFQSRIERRGRTDHLDYLEQIIPADSAAPTDKKQINHLEQIAGQLLLAGWEPMANQFYSSIFFLLKEPRAYDALVKEIREEFKSYHEITPDTVANMKYLHACLQETFRIHQNTSDGLPRMSPGAMVDGTYIPKGVSILRPSSLNWY
jgi:cytochrome P450